MVVCLVSFLTRGGGVKVSIEESYFEGFIKRNGMMLRGHLDPYLIKIGISDPSLFLKEKSLQLLPIIEKYKDENPAVPHIMSDFLLEYSKDHQEFKATEMLALNCLYRFIIGNTLSEFHFRQGDLKKAIWLYGFSTNQAGCLVGMCWELYASEKGSEVAKARHKKKAEIDQPKKDYVVRIWESGDDNQRGWASYARCAEYLVSDPYMQGTPYRTIYQWISEHVKQSRTKNNLSNI